MGGEAKADIVEQLRKHHRDVGLSDDVESWLTVSADEIERLRGALHYYANKTQEEWVNVTGADDGVVARAALEGKQ